MIWKKRSRWECKRQMKRRRRQERKKIRKIKRQQRHQRWDNNQLRQKRQYNRKRTKTIQSRVTILFVMSFLSVLFVKQNLLGAYTKEVCLVEQKKIEPIDNLPNISISKVSAVLLSEHTISNYASSEDRNWNMWLVAQILNKEASVIMPGETFSYLNIVGDTTAEKGFRIAGVISNGKSSSDFGGGVCQVTSTYNSALVEAGIATHAMVHSVKSKYIMPERGDREAAVAYSSNMDFKFTNTTSYPLKPQLIVEGGNVTAKIFYIIEYQEI